jgi:hypothetical protein
MQRSHAALCAILVLMVTGTACARGGRGGVHASSGHASSGTHAIRGYTKKNGTYVAPSHATNPNKTKRDNFSAKGNVNPYTGKAGTKDSGQ